MRRGFVIGLPGLVLATGAGLLVETHRVANAPLPHFDDLDPSGVYGDPGGPPLAVSVLGDSSITGPGLASGGETWVARLADRLPVRCELTSYAKGGSRVHDVLDTQCERALERPPGIFVVSVGANDVMHGTPVRRFKRELEELLGRLAGVAPVVSLGIGDLSVIPRFPVTLRPLVRWRCGVIDRAHEAVTDALGDVHRVPVHEVADPLFADPPGDLFAADRFHPNALGHSMWAECFEPFLAPLISDASTRIGYAPVMTAGTAQ